MGLTNHIHQAAQSRQEYDDSFSEIVHEIQSEIRRYIESQYPRGVSGIPSVTDFVQQTFAKLQQTMRQNKEAFLGMSSKEFKIKVKRIAHNQIRNAKKSKFVRLPVVNGNHSDIAEANEASSDEIFTNKQLSILFLSLLLEDQKPEEALVTVLGIGMKFSHRDIAEAIKKSNGTLPSMSDSKIGRILSRSVVRVTKRLEELGEEDLGPMADD